MTEEPVEDAGAAVLLVAHGSRLADSNAEVEALAGRLARALGPRRRVCHAFLELASPSIDEAIDALVEAGVDHVILIPYFLAAGRHVLEDIPAIIRAARARHSGLDIQMTGHFGAQEGVLDLLCAMAVDRARS